MDQEWKSEPRDPRYDLEERTARFGEDVVDLARKVVITPVTVRLVPQLVAAGTSVGGNYGEAQEAESRKDFRHKCKISLKESKESTHYLRMIARAQPDLADEARKLWSEGRQLVKIFAAIIRKLDRELGD